MTPLPHRTHPGAGHRALPAERQHQEHRAHRRRHQSRVPAGRAEQASERRRRGRRGDAAAADAAGDDRTECRIGGLRCAGVDADRAGGEGGDRGGDHTEGLLAVPIPEGEELLPQGDVVRALADTLPVHADDSGLRAAVPEEAVPDHVPDVHRVDCVAVVHGGVDDHDYR